MSDQEDSGYSRPPVAQETSRLIVKNIPKHCTEQRLKEHFQKNGGSVTDCKIMRTHAGKPRLFGFIGYATVTEASAAKKYYDRSFLDTSRLAVDYALPKGNSSIPRAWSRYSESSSRYQELHKPKEEETRKKRGADEITAAPDDDSPDGMTESKKRKLDEFLGLSKKKMPWQNDTDLGVGMAGASSSSKKSKSGSRETTDKEQLKRLLKKHGGDSDESDDDYQDFGGFTPKHEADEAEESEEQDLSDEENMEEADGSDEEDAKKQKKSKKHDSSKMDVDEGDDGETEAKEDKSKSKKSKSSKKRPEEVEQEQADTQEHRGDAVIDTGRLFVRNLPFSASEEDLRTLFSSFGAINEVHISIDKFTKRSKGYGFVQFLFPGHAVEAQSQLDGTIFQGRLLHVLAAVDAAKEEETLEGQEEAEPTKKRAPGPQLGAKGALVDKQGFVSEYQKKKIEKQKALANQDYNWNSLFIRPDAVAGAMAASLNVSKSELLDKESSSSMAVRLALGETNIIKETKQFLEKEGISVDALKNHFNKEVLRSSCVLLVKNIAISTQIEELRNMFGRFGSLVKVVMTPSRTLSVIEFAAPSEARAAFKNLAFKQFKDAPLYLEWAPIGIVGEEAKEEAKKEHGESLQPIPDKPTKTVISHTSQDAPVEISTSEQHVSSEEAKKDKKKDKKDKKRAEKSGNAAAPSKPAAAPEPEPVVAEISKKKNKDKPVDPLATKLQTIENVVDAANVTLFVKNLNFKTSEDSLRRHVQGLVGDVNHVSIAMHLVKDEMKSHGYGFVECKTRDQALKLWKLLQGTALDGHQLEIKFSQPKAQAVSLQELHQMVGKRKVSAVTQAKSNKLVVKNVPFEATRKEIRDLFAPFGELRSVRLPNKPGGKGHRGFAFVEYVTPDDAAAAIEAVGQSHLYNRHLVIDYAEQDGDIEAIRAKSKLE